MMFDTIDFLVLVPIIIGTSDRVFSFSSLPWDSQIPIGRAAAFAELDRLDLNGKKCDSMIEMEYQTQDKNPAEV